MTNPFDDENGTFLVLLNDEERSSLWPAFIDVPAGWRVVHPSSSRETSLDFVQRNWSDMRPKSLRLSGLSSSSDATPSGPPCE